jgi:hypothetical protein
MCERQDSVEPWGPATRFICPTKNYNSICLEYVVRGIGNLLHIEINKIHVLVCGTTRKGGLFSHKINTNMTPFCDHDICHEGLQLLSSWTFLALFFDSN